MNFTVNGEKNRLTIVLEGSISSDNAMAIQQDIEAIVWQSSLAMPTIALDMQNVEYITSAGLHVLLNIKNKYQNVAIPAISEEALEALSYTGMDEVFHLEETKNIKWSLPQNLEREKAGSVAKTIPDVPLTGLNDTTDPFAFTTVVDMFEEQVRKNPEKLAVVSSEGFLSYEKLNQMANQVANALLMYGVKRDEVVCILLPRGIMSYVVSLGVLKSGAAYNFINTAYPDERVSYIFHDAECRYLISDKKTSLARLELFDDYIQKRPLFIEDLLTNPYMDNPRIDIAETDLCYCIYTSGSTGNPKCVMLEHQGLTNHIRPSKKNELVTAITEKGSVLLAMAQMTFDVSVFEEYVGLTSGMTIAYAKEEEILHPAAMNDFLTRHHVDAVCTTPAYLNTLVNIPELANAISAFKVVDVGAEAFPGALYTKIRKINPNVIVINCYGPTETTITCTTKTITSPENITIGKPFSNIYAFIVDEKLNEVPKGEKGELLICGKGVCRGYRNLPEKTAKAFVEFKGARAFRTGDIARINENDEIEYFGRMDNQVKLRGLRIELDEVEKTIGYHPGVKMCAARVFDNRILCVYYTLNKQVNAEEIKAFAKRHLAHYMIPDVFVALDSMPLTLNNKIDRKALRKPTLSDTDIVLPSNETQKKLLDIFQYIFEDVPLGINSNILDLGVSSLDMMLISSMIEKAFDIPIEFSDIHKKPTVQGLEEILNEKKHRTKLEAQEHYLLNQSIQHIYPIWKENQEDTVWNLPELYVFEASIEPMRLQKAVLEVLGSHTGLWWKVEEGQDELYARPLSEPHTLDLPIIHVSEEEMESVRENLVQPFAITAPPYFRGNIYVTKEHTYLFLDFCHVVTDGSSMQLVLKEICQAYEGATIEKESFTVFDLEEEQRLFRENGGLAKAVQYYDKLFAREIPREVLPCKLSDDVTEIGRFTRRLGITSEEIQKIVKPLRVSPTILFLGLMGVVFSKKANCEHLCIPVAYNGRNDSRLKSTVGFLATETFVPTHWQQGMDICSYLRNVQKNFFECMGIVEQPTIAVATKYPALNEICFSFLGETNLSFTIDNTTATIEELSEQGAGGIFKIYQEVMVIDGEYYVSMEYRKNYVNEAMLEKIVDEYRQLLHSQYFHNLQ